MSTIPQKQKKNEEKENRLLVVVAKHSILTIKTTRNVGYKWDD